ncbi:SCAR-like protein 2 isoform X2 [Phalaenopsis equestris]|uniref:SCAR-like protein 2 isoform X2 n=1 Tax=Phalaenopsis equestris TaxID=78828 RepID=UPI0009E36746|nr:SCAR-like protein 2 isoform X2 [Phalaenopsis equestris]
MPLVRFELKNEYGLGDPRLYQGAPKEEEDPMNILGGVTVSGLVGILRQLGDLAELAAVVFHGVHQQVMTTAARGHKVLNRIRKIEATLPQFEMAVQGQRSHIHFAYIAGCDWHANIQISRCQPFFSDLPEFMLDSYEECRDPPRLHLLDKFDGAGSGACLKRYSDPSYFRIASSDRVMAEKANSRTKAQRKKQRARGLHGFAHHSINMTLRGRSSIQLGSLITDRLSFSVDEASISDTLSIPGSDKRSGCIEVEDSPKLMSKEMYDGMLAPDVETTKKVDSVFNNDNKVAFSGCDGKLEMVNTVSQMLWHDIRVDRLKTKAAELFCSSSNRNHLTNGLGTQGEHNSRSLTWDENATDSLGACVKTISTLSSSISKEYGSGNPEICDRYVFSTYSAATNEKAEIIKPSSSKFSDGIILCRAPDPDLLSVTLETTNWLNEMDDNEMHGQNNFLPDTIKVEVPFTEGGQINELMSQLDEHMDATNALDSKVQTNFGRDNEQEVILLPHLNYNGMECEISQTLAVTSPSLDCLDSGIDHEAHTSLKKNFPLQVIFDHLQSSGPPEFENMLLYSVRNSVSECLTDDCTMKNDSERIDSTSCLGLIPQAGAFDGIPLEDLLAQNSLGDKSGKTIGEKEALCEHRTKQEIESRADSNCLGADSLSSTEKVIAATKLVCPDSKIHAVSHNSASFPAVIIPCALAVVVDEVPPKESSSQDYFSETSAKTASEKKVFWGLQTKQESGSTDDSNCQGTEYQSSMENGIAVSKLDDSDFDTQLAFLNGGPCPGFIFPTMQVEIIDGIPPEESLAQDSCGDTSAKTAKEKEVLSKHQNKQGTESMTNSNCQGTYQISMEMVIPTSNFDGPNSETHVASCGSSDACASSTSCGLIISNNVDNLSFSTISSDVASSRSPINDSSPRNDFEDPRGIVSAHLTIKPVILPSDVTAATAVVSQVFPGDSCRKSSINIWTNGGLLGLEPSKPLDISAPNTYMGEDNYDGGSAANSQPCVFASGNDSKKLFFETNKLNLISYPQRDVTICKISDDQSDSMLSKQRAKGSIQASSFCKFDKAQNAYFNGTGSEIDRVQGKEGDIVSSEADIYTKNNLSKQRNVSMSVGFSSLARRFLVSSLPRKSPMIGIGPLYELMSNNVDKLHNTKNNSKDNERTKLTVSSVPSHKLGNKEDSAHGFSEKLVCHSFDSSGYQSPPLEHMKFSLQQMNDSDVPNLNLEFISSQQEGNTGNAIFPSFQLISESFQPPLDGVSESDDDTFCRSCPYSSDDLLTLHSESDAEIWGEDEIDIPNKIKATGSISNFIEFNECNACSVSQVNEVANIKHVRE